MPSNSVEYDQQYWLEHGGKHTLKARLARAEAEIERLRAAAQAVIDSINDENEIDPDAVFRLSKMLDRDKCRYD
jgi:hypothetical protein